MVAVPLTIPGSVHLLLLSLYRRIASSIASFFTRRISVEEDETSSNASSYKSCREEELPDWETAVFRNTQQRILREEEERSHPENYGYSDRELDEIHRMYWTEYHVPRGDEDDYSEYGPDYIEYPGW